MDEEEFPPQVLREYALLADGERGALVGPHGDLCWMCVPRWDSDAVFASLVGAPGAYAVTPKSRYVWGGSYEPGTLIWTCRWVTVDGITECREALAFPGGPAYAVVLRRVIAREGDAAVRVVCDPRPGFGGTKVSLPRHTETGHWTAEAGDLGIRWTGFEDAEVRATTTGRRLELDLQVPAGGHHDLVLELGDLPGRPVSADHAWKATERAWREESPRLHTIADRDARHAYMIMRGLTSRTGGMVAATTTSLPERSQSGRNYDYRYVWIRDQCYAGQAAAAAGAYPLLDAAVRFVAERVLADGPRLRPAYTVVGGPIPDQRRLDLPGYPGGYDRIGNQVTHQFQLDVFGDALLLFAAAERHGRLGDEARRAANVTMSAIRARWRDLDAGIWELEDRAWTHSRLNCAAGLYAFGDAVTLADTIVADTARHATHPSGRWQRAADDERLDGALLLSAVRGAVPARAPRSRRTLEAYAETLTEDGYAYRFRHDERPLDHSEGAFVLCGLLLALATHQQGDRAEALRWFERNRAACGPAGLLAEEYDVEQRQLRGNLPQAFAHALVLESAARLTEESDGGPMVG
jgi:alpha,alpha-trehalase